MRTIAHISDVHFGREDPRVVDGLVADLGALRPDVVALSGDLTQRARPAQFRAARAFLDRIAAPKVIVPGNHDVPLFDLVRRTLSPLGRYGRFITPDLSPAYVDGELYVAGVSTARSLTWKEGRISVWQIERLRRAFCGDPIAGRLHVLVAHHPFTPAPDHPRQHLVGRGARALRALSGCDLDLILTGHLHLRSHGPIDRPVERLTRSMLAIHAGSATSVRLRGEPNSYNWLEVDGPRLVLTVRAWNGSGFEPYLRSAFERRDDGWHASDVGALEASAAEVPP